MQGNNSTGIRSGSPARNGAAICCQVEILIRWICRRK